MTMIRKSRDQGALDAAILSQSRKAQNCYIAMAAMRPDRRGLEPAAGTCHNADSPRTVAMTILPTQGLAAGSVSPMSHHKRRIALLVIVMVPPKTATKSRSPWANARPKPRPASRERAISSRKCGAICTLFASNSRRCDLRVNEYTPFCNGPGDVKSPRVIVTPPSSRFCPWSALRPPHYVVRRNGELSRYAWFVG